MVWSYHMNSIQIDRFEEETIDMPQVFILWPLLFIIYMNDMRDACNKFHSILFVDDSILTSTPGSINIILKKILIPHTPPPHPSFILPEEMALAWRTNGGAVACLLGSGAALFVADKVCSAVAGKCHGHFLYSIGFVKTISQVLILLFYANGH